MTLPDEEALKLAEGFAYCDECGAAMVCGSGNSCGGTTTTKEYDIAVVRRAYDAGMARAEEIARAVTTCGAATCSHCKTASEAADAISAERKGSR